MRCPIVHRVDQVLGMFIITPHLECNHTLPPRRDKIVGRKNLAFQRESEPLQTGPGQNNPAPIFVFAQLAQAGRHIAAEIGDSQVGPLPAS